MCQETQLYLSIAMPSLSRRRAFYMAKIKQRADGRYLINVYIGRGTDGKNKYKSVYGSSTRECQRKAEEIRSLIGKGIDINAQRDSFSEWRDRWLRSKTCRAGQLASYKACAAHLIEDLGQMEICKIRTSDIQMVINKLSNKGLSRKTLQQIRMAAKQIFQLAISDRVLDYNPAIDVTIPKNAASAENREPLSDEQIEWIRNTPHRAQLPAMIMLYCGLRRGEVLALRWSDIDFEKKILHVRRSIEMVNGQPFEKIGGKSDAATRDVTIPNILIEFLEKERNSILKKTKELYPLITEKTNGGFHSTKTWDRMWESFMNEINILHGDFGSWFYDSDKKQWIQSTSPRIIRENCKLPTSIRDPRGVPCVIETFTAHQLRHTYATLLFEAGVDVLTAQKLLGHAKASTTLNIYTHLRSRKESENIDKLNDYLSNNISQMLVSEG